jgi:hypothetical protein
MTDIQETIINLIKQFYREQSKPSPIKETDPQADGLSVIFKLKDRQLRISYSGYINFYSIEVWKLNKDGTPDLNLKYTEPKKYYNHTWSKFLTKPLREFHFQPVELEQSVNKITSNEK